MNDPTQKKIYKDYLEILVKRWKFIICIASIVTTISLISSFFLHPVYRAETQILPPHISISGKNISIMNQLANEKILPASALGIRISNQLFIGMLHSRTAYDHIVERFDLMNAYRTDSPEAARNLLSESLDITTGKYGIISLSVEPVELAPGVSEAFGGLSFGLSLAFNFTTLLSPGPTKAPSIL